MVWQEEKMFYRLSNIQKYHVFFMKMQLKEISQILCKSTPTNYRSHPISPPTNVFIACSICIQCVNVNSFLFVDSTQPQTQHRAQFANVFSKYFEFWFMFHKLYSIFKVHTPTRWDIQDVERSVCDSVCGFLYLALRSHMKFFILDD